MFALIDMRPNLIACGVILVLGLGLLQVLASRQGTSGKKWQAWMPWAALVAGPVVAFAYWAMEVFVRSREYYLGFSDGVEELPAVLTIGAFVGVVVAIASALTSYLRSSRKE